MGPHSPPPHHRPAEHLRRIGAPGLLVSSRLLFVERFLLQALRAAIHQSIHFHPYPPLLRRQLSESFVMFGIAAQRTRFEQAVGLLVRGIAREVDFHGLGCPCVGDDECRWLRAMAACQYGDLNQAIASLNRFATNRAATAVPALFEPVMQALLAAGWALPPWSETTDARAAANAALQPTPRTGQAPARSHLRLVYSR